MADRDPQAIDASRIVQVGRAPNEVIADLWRQVLEDEGIVVLLKPAGAGPSLGSNALSEHLLFVREDQAESARDIIASLESGTDDS